MLFISTHCTQSKDDLPIRVSSHNGYFGNKSAQETPNTQTSVFEYEDGKKMILI